ncbi:hypothetical protein R1T43_04505 [Alteromonas sp. CI.11.F.A3]|uniref:hypothetical protein n=1 Tax=Alteromonas sp. CI.11.F.A3 TaxID=3079555 RepID=UPI00294234CD|nr:hypothetical protein [Alteromonas sp. CI.11.F.A3]WOI38302.1 hypothetical protein R1T43_04505 [Alteromonas sp. CI.11.F.A3]
MNVINSDCYAKFGKSLNRYKTASRLSSVCILASSLFGCTTFPYVEDPRPEFIRACTMCESSEVELQRAMAYVDYTYDGYRRKLLEDAKQSQDLSQGLIALGTVTLGLAAFEANIDTFKAAGLLGGGAYHLGTANENVGRRSQYIAGMRAMVCIKDIVSPMAGITSNYEHIQKNAERLRSAMDEYAIAAGDLTNNMNQLFLYDDTTKSLKAAAQAQLKVVDSDRERAAQLLQSTNTLLAKSSTIGPRVFAQVDNIRVAVDEALTSTLASTDNISSHIALLSDYAQYFTPGLDFAQILQTTLASAGSPATDKQMTDIIQQSLNNLDKDSKGNAENVKNAIIGVYEKVISNISAAMGEIQAKRQIMLARASELNGLLAMPLNLNETTFKSCGALTDNITTQLKLDHSSLEFTQGTIQTATVEVSGGTKPYTAQLTRTPNSSVNVATVARGSGIIVTLTSEAKAGEVFTIKVKDSSTQHAIINVSIKEPVKNKTANNKGAANDVEITQAALKNCENSKTNMWNETFGVIGYPVMGTHANGIVLENPALLGSTISGEIALAGQFSLPPEARNIEAVKSALLAKLATDPLLKSLHCKNITSNEKLTPHASLANALSSTPDVCKADDDVGRLKCALRTPMEAGDCGDDFTLAYSNFSQGILTVTLRDLDSICPTLYVDKVDDLVAQAKVTINKSLKRFTGGNTLKYSDLKFSNYEEIKAKIDGLQEGKVQ